MAQLHSSEKVNGGFSGRGYRFTENEGEKKKKELVTMMKLHGEGSDDDDESDEDNTEISNNENGIEQEPKKKRIDPETLRAAREAAESIASKVHFL